MRGGFGTFGFPNRRFFCTGSILLLLLSSDPAFSARANEAVPATRTDPVSIKSPRLYDGRPLEEWRKRLKSIGPGVAGVEREIPGLRAIAEDSTVDPGLRSHATLMLGRLGSPGLEALPTLKKLLLEPATPDAVPAVWSAKAIALLGPPARNTVPQLIQVLEHEETPASAQLACLEALARIGGHHPKAIPAVVRALDRAAGTQTTQGDRSLLLAAIDALFLIGPGASIAVPDLMDLLDHPNDIVRMKVVQALGAIGKSASPATTTVAELLVFDEADAVRKEAASALASLGQDAERMLMNLARDEEDTVRQYSIEALSSISPRREGLKKVLAEALDDDASAVRLAAAVALKDDRMYRTAILEVLSRLVSDADRTVRLSAANELAAMQPDEDERERIQAVIEAGHDPHAMRLWERLEKSRNERD